MLVFWPLHVVAQPISRKPKLRLEPELGRGISRRFVRALAIGQLHPSRYSFSALLYVPLEREGQATPTFTVIGFTGGVRRSVREGLMPEGFELDVREAAVVLGIAGAEREVVFGGGGADERVGEAEVGFKAMGFDVLGLWTKWTE